MILTIVDRGSKVACVEVKGRVTRIPDEQKYFLLDELRKVNKDTKEILRKNKWVLVGPKGLTEWQS